MFPWLVTLWKSGRRLSDIEYLAIKEFGGKLVENTVTSQSATGDGATLTASSGKDMYLAYAKCVIANKSNLDRNAIVALIVNTVTKDTFDISSHNAGDAAGDNTLTHIFPVGFKVAAAEVIKLEVTAIGATMDITTTIQCIEETTGASPAA